MSVFATYEEAAAVRLSRGRAVARLDMDDREAVGMVGCPEDAPGVGESEVDAPLADARDAERGEPVQGP
ncbi:hypothetical protein ABZ446_03330 [Streptomyces sp. NPDC005813]|uniref:hypothetical protein n=1 Tax=Streptomyces sp. NPDC005813 TaxID=3155592 RepID=UPI0033E28770